MAREHNRVAKELAHINPHWDDETLFQEARRINIAIIQHITYNEFLPILLGKDIMEKFGLLLQKEVSNDKKPAPVMFFCLLLNYGNNAAYLYQVSTIIR